MKKTIDFLWVFSIISILVVFALKAYYQGRESGLVDGMNSGYDLGYKAKKPPIIIVTPPRDGTFLHQREEGKDSVLWRI